MGFLDSNKHVGNFNTVLHNGFYELYELSEFDEEFTQGTQLKEGEKIYRIQTPAMKYHDIAPLVKINYAKKLVYYLVEDAAYPWFETKGIKMKRINF